MIHENELFAFSGKRETRNENRKFTLPRNNADSRQLTERTNERLNELCYFIICNYLFSNSQDLCRHRTDFLFRLLWLSEDSSSS